MGLFGGGSVWLIEVWGGATRSVWLIRGLGWQWMAFFLVFCIGGGWCIGLLYGGNGWLRER